MLIVSLYSSGIGISGIIAIRLHPSRRPTCTPANDYLTPLNQTNLQCLFSLFRRAVPECK